MSALVHAGHGETDAEGLRAFEAGTRKLLVPGATWHLAPLADCGLASVGAALDKLERMPARSKERMVMGLAHAAAWDGRLWPAEYALLRVVADSLGCPLPPRVPRGMTGVTPGDGEA